ncbi:MAG: isoprenylcysteine carboxylmethyltransferase family protein [Verrucomicrobia bacterium]|nr:MAG: isoprenylcysteine carboxylmethyltransferase family protein [Verrucomicrobiota bacterium]
MHVAHRWQKNRELCQSGIYQFCRNPLYFFSFLGFCGICLISQSILFTLIGCTLFLILYRSVILSEERHLLQLFPTEFPIYQKTVPRFWPRGLPRLSSHALQVNNVAFFRSLTEVIWFLIFSVLIDLVVYARGREVIPTLFHWF